MPEAPGGVGGVHELLRLGVHGDGLAGAAQPGWWWQTNRPGANSQNVPQDGAPTRSTVLRPALGEAVPVAAVLAEHPAQVVVEALALARGGELLCRLDQRVLSGGDRVHGSS